MKPEEQRIAIAEACDLFVCSGCLNMIDPDVCHCGDSAAHHGMGSGHSFVPVGCVCGYADDSRRETQWNEVPDYLNSLDAMHKAEIGLGLEKCAEYLNWLSDIVGNDSMAGFPPDDDDATRWLWNIHVATAAQRAEAFLKTIGKWKEQV